ncbi:MAG: GLUG motif-containing protein [Planctomycetota bacterium]
MVGYVRGNTYYGAPPVISNCYSSSTVSAASAGGLVHINCGAIVTECHATRAISVGTVTGAGGLVCVNQTMAPWYTEGVIANCYATGNVSGHDRVGGLIGYMENGTISDCYVQGASICGDSLCIGGLVGVVDAGTISGCYTTSSCSVSGWGGVGGLAGEVNSGATVTNCHSESSVSGAAFYGYDDDCISLGGLIGSNSGTVSNCHATGVVSGIVGAGVGDYFGGLIGNNGGTVSACYATGNISEGRSTMGGLVGYNAAGVTSYGTISDCYATGNVTGIRYLGGLAGDNRGTITNSRAEGNVTSTSTGVTDWSVGGFVGRNQSIIDQSYAIGTVSGYNRVGGLAGTNTTGEFTGGGVIGDITDCYATGSVSGNDKVGGLVGYNYTDASVANCFSAGSVSGISNTGGLVGERYFNSGAIANSFWDKQTSGQTTSDGGTGKTTAEMQTQTTFTSAGWDFLGETPNGTEDIWRLCVDLTDYPRFVWEKRLLGDFLCPDGSDFKDYAVLV